MDRHTKQSIVKKSQMHRLSNTEKYKKKTSCYVLYCLVLFCPVLMILQIKHTLSL